MAITITDPALIATLMQLNNSAGVVDFKTADGTILGRFTPESSESLPAWVESKVKTLSAEDLAERRKNPDDQPLDLHAFLADFKARHPHV